MADTEVSFSEVKAGDNIRFEHDGENMLGTVLYAREMQSEGKDVIELAITMPNGGIISRIREPQIKITVTDEVPVVEEPSGIDLDA